VIRKAGTEVICHSLDLNQPPGQLIADVTALAEVIAATAGAAEARERR
jgi:hypothetical protein